MNRATHILLGHIGSLMPLAVTDNHFNTFSYTWNVPALLAADTRPNMIPLSSTYKISGPLAFIVPIGHQIPSILNDLMWRNIA